MRNFKLLSLFTALLFAVAILSGCTKEGAAGKDGANGQDGADGTSGCIKCHDDSQSIFAAGIQWETSVHATGGNFERNSTDCAPCHTSQGFIEVCETGAMTTAEAINNPAPVNCYTCHKIHETYTEEDWALTSPEPVAFWINGVVSDQGKANQCAKCHQPRIPDPLPAPGGEDVTIGSPYWGPHHGPQAAVFAGTGGYEVAGSMAYTNSKHTDMVENSCVDCHMATAYGTQAGGHTMGTSYAYHGHMVVNEAGCVACHEGDDLNAMIETAAAAIDEKLAGLRSLLLEQGVLDSSNHAIPGAMTADQAGGVINYLMILEDRSGGMHNSKYAKALLTNSAEALTN
jgi:hypothetical protein